MPPVSQLDTPPASPKSPPRKRRKFSLKLRGKNSKTDSEPQNNNTENAKTPKKFYPIFSKASTPSRTEKFADDGDCVDFSPTKAQGLLPPPYSGVRNLGNTCYANAVLQVLRHCPGFAGSVSSLAGDLKNQETEKIAKETDTEETVADDSVVHSPSDTEKVFHIVNKLNELICDMQGLEEDYQMNGENCEQLKSIRDGLVLAAEPADLMDAFREVNPMFCSYEQHDAQEFLRNLLINIQDAAKEVTKNSKTSRKCADDKTHGSQTNESVKTPKSSIAYYFTKVPSVADKNSNNSTFIEKLFQGRLVSQTKCLTCEEVKKRHEEFQDISVPMQKESLDMNPRKAFSPLTSEKTDTRSLDWAISQFASVESLNGDNKYFCDFCTTHTEAEIKTCFDLLPEVLTVHLKRFTATASGYMSGWVSKINSNLETPETLLLDQWCSTSVSERDTSYELFGIVMHSGMTSCSGHYQAYVKISDIGKDDNNNVKTSLSGACIEQGSSDLYDTSGTKDAETVDENGDAVLQAENDSSVTTQVNTARGTCGKTPAVARQNATSHKKGKQEAGDPNLATDNGSGDTSHTKSTEKIHCMSGITKYFHKSAKYPKPSNHSSVVGSDGNVPKGNNVETEKSLRNKPKRRKTESIKLETNKLSTEKIQNVQCRERRSKNNHVRKLEFQHKRKDTCCKGENKENVPLPVERNHLKAHSDTDDDSVVRDGKVLQCEGSTTPAHRGKKWVQFDDATVHILEDLDVARILSSCESAFTSPYLLFYKRC